MAIPHTRFLNFVYRALWTTFDEVQQFPSSKLEIFAVLSLGNP